MKNLRMAFDISTVKVGFAIYDIEDSEIICGGVLKLHKSNPKFSGEETYNLNKALFLENIEKLQEELELRGDIVFEIVIETSIIPSTTGRKLLMYQAAFETILGIFFPEAQVKFIDAQTGQVKALGKNPVYDRNNDIKQVSKDKAKLIAPELSREIDKYDDLADAINLCVVSDQCKGTNWGPKYIESWQKEEKKKWN